MKKLKGIKTSNRYHKEVLSELSPVRTLLISEFEAAKEWLARKKNVDGKRIGKISQVDEIVKYEKDTFSLYGRTKKGKTVQINDIRGEHVFLRKFSTGRTDTSDYFLFCLGGGKYVLTDWITVWNALKHMYHYRKTMIYRDCWRLDKERFISLICDPVSDTI